MSCHDNVESSPPFPRWVSFPSGEQRPHCCSWYWTQRTGSHFCLRPTFPGGQFSSVTKTNFFLWKHENKNTSAATQASGPITVLSSKQNKNKAPCRQWHLGAQKENSAARWLVPSKHWARTSISTTSTVFTLAELHYGEQSLINMEQLC